MEQPMEDVEMQQSGQATTPKQKMVDLSQLENAPELAENLKTQGNEAFKINDFPKAITYYTQALDYLKNEAIYTNRAASYIQLKKYKEALFDCEQALYCNKTFVKAHQRAYKCYLSLGDLERAFDSLQSAKELGDGTALQQLQLVKTLLDIEKQVKNLLSLKKYSDVLIYSNQLLNHCTDSMKCLGYRLEAMVALNKVGEAIEYTTKMQTQFIENAEFLYWRGRLLVYNGNMDKGRQYLREALNKDPDNVTFQKGWRNLQKLEKVKKEGTDAFSSGQYREAVERFTECLELDPLNNTYNSTVLFNRASAFLKQGLKQDALNDLNRALDINEDYVKALLKRSELNLAMENYEDAVKDLERVKTVDPATPGLKQKLNEAKLELKKSKRKDYYKILDVSKTATEEEIKKQYKRQALRWHPDKHSSGEEQQRLDAEKMFKDIGEACAVLTDPKKRQMYDEGADLEEIENPGAGGGHGFHGDPNEIFQMFFGGGGGGMGGHPGFSSSRGGGGGGSNFSFRFA